MIGRYNMQKDQLQKVYNQEREEEIKAFVPKEYWSIELIASNKEENNLTLKFYGKDNEKIQQ